LKIVFHHRFYEVYALDPAAALGRMEPMVKALEEEYEFLEPKPASEVDLQRVHGREHIQWKAIRGPGGRIQPLGPGRKREELCSGVL
jgi:hypothetical protein